MSERTLQSIAQALHCSGRHHLDLLANCLCHLLASHSVLQLCILQNSSPQWRKSCANRRQNGRGWERRPFIKLLSFLMSFFPAFLLSFLMPLLLSLFLRTASFLPAGSRDSLSLPSSSLHSVAVREQPASHWIRSIQNRLNDARTCR